MKFKELGILPALEVALVKEKIVEPTPIQKKSAPAILAGESVYISSETGSGKTLAYLLPLLSKIDFDSKFLQIIILAPTHELASQIQNQLIFLKQNSGLGLRSQLVIGGTSTKRQLEKLKKKPHVIVGSVERILEFIKQKKIKAHYVNSVVIDEVDKLLLGESQKKIEVLLRSMQSGRQMIFASATIQMESKSVAESMAENLIYALTETNKVSGDIEHFYFIAQQNEKLKLLRQLIRAIDPERAIIFTHQNETAVRIAKRLAEHGIATGELHGECNRLDRVKTITQFRNGKLKLLIASDMAARGLDIKGVSHIFNFDMPGKSKNYLHRAGRTGRAGESGNCISLVSDSELKITRRYQRELNIEMKEACFACGEITIKK